MAKELSAIVKLQIKGGAANPSPPIGPALGAKGVNIMEFCKQFNARTQEQAGKVLPVIINVYTDKSFDFVIKRPPVAIQILEVTKIKAGSATSNRKKVGALTWDQVRKIAEDKIVDMNCFTIESAMNMVVGTARSMGVTVSGEKPY
ncbi:50S ribosomal protein L11 [Sphingobacteriaceae bacterium]|jgi:large subunit ribosomal protein L11|nr:50S ribosomal protein L11 [Sphingobacteriaceae bacterium]